MIESLSTPPLGVFSIVDSAPGGELIKLRQRYAQATRVLREQSESLKEQKKQISSLEISERKLLSQKTVAVEKKAEAQKAKRAAEKRAALLGEKLAETKVPELEKEVRSLRATSRNLEKKLALYNEVSSKQEEAFKRRIAALETELEELQDDNKGLLEELQKWRKLNTSALRWDLERSKRQIDAITRQLPQAGPPRDMNLSVRERDALEAIREETGESRPANTQPTNQPEEDGCGLEID